MAEPPSGTTTGEEGPRGIGSFVVRAILLVFGSLLAIPLLPFSVRVVREYERGVIFRLGRLVGAKGPGLFILLPFVDRMVKVDLRTVTLNVPTQEAITRDNVTLKADAVVYFRVVDPRSAVVRIADYMRATSQIAQTTLRSVVGQSELDELLGQRDRINHRLQQIIDEHTEPWGVKVSAVEVKDVELPPEMQRAMARQAEAERERRAKVIAADGEYQASGRLREAASVMSAEPITLQLRFMQTLAEVAGQNESTILFPLPIKLLEPFMANGSSTGEVERRDRSRASAAVPFEDAE